MVGLGQGKTLKLTETNWHVQREEHLPSIHLAVLTPSGDHAGLELTEVSSSITQLLFRKSRIEQLTCCLLESHSSVPKLTYGGNPILKQKESDKLSDYSLIVKVIDEYVLNAYFLWKIGGVMRDLVTAIIIWYDFTTRPIL